jgi:hypothetical protein
MKNTTKKHYEQIALVGCILCRYLDLGQTPCEIHHIRRFGGKRDNSPVIGLCTEHHRGNTGVHGLGHKGFEKHYGISEHELLELSNKQSSSLFVND